jgi:site-specific recombinase XerD
MDDDSALIEHYLGWQTHNRGRAGATIYKYRRYLHWLVEFLRSRECSLREATLALLEEFTGIEAHRRKLSPRARRPVVAAVRGFYTWLHRRHLLDENPAAALPYPKAGLRLPAGMSLKHAEALLMQCDIDTFLGIRDLAILSVFIGCGVRVTGCVNLNQSSLLYVDYEGCEYLILKVREKGKKERLVPAPDELRVLLRCYLGHKELESIDRSLPDGDQVLFVSTNNRNVSPADYYGEARRIAARSVNDMIVTYGLKAGIPRAHCHPHALRHLYGTELAEDDVNILHAQALLGHASPKTTEIYAHVAMKKLITVVNKSSPLRKMRTPVTDLVRELERRGL